METNYQEIQEIHRKITQSHLVYLDTDDSPSKLIQRQDLEGFIEKFLCLVPNENKYVFKETANILHRSAAELKDFSGYKACTGWTAISLYAANLLAQPWRKEYKRLKTYCGYYKYEIEANLIGAEVIFELMGYKSNGFGELILEGPIDPDKVASVSKDAIVAFVECKILKQIWEELSNKLNISWLEILNFRENYVGTPNAAIRALSYCNLEKSRKSEQESSYYNSQKIYQYNMVPQINTLYHSMLPKFNYISNQNLNCNMEFQNPQYFVQNSFINPEQNNFSTNLYINNSKLHDIAVPLKSVTRKYHPSSIIINTGNDVQDFHNSSDSSKNIKTNDVTNIYVSNTSRINKPINQKENSRYETGNLIDSKNKKINDTPLARSKVQVMNNSNFTQISNESDKLSDQNKKIEMKYSQERLNIRGQKKNFKDENIYIKDEQVSLVNSNSQIQDDTFKKIDVTIEETKKDWNCETCTYLNKLDVEICEMCGKSRRKGNEDEPLVSGGKECPKCTLINKKDNFNCEACNTSLKDSPTYI